jgi:putative membrane protein
MLTRTRAANVLRGGLIGAAEAVPGISGGTIALVTGVYETVISSAGHLVSGVRAVATDRTRARAEFRAVRWDVLVPLLIGMVPALLLALLLLAPAIERYPVQMRALLFGMVAAAVVVPARMVGRWRARQLLLAGAAAVVGFLLTGALQLSVEPSLPVVFVVAAIAICALVLPGVSGAFLLLAFGLYGPTRDAVRHLDLAYIGVFLLGAVCGLSLFVKGLQWLLAHYHRATLAVMTGLIVGALRALWPWQGEHNELLAPAGPVVVAALLCLLGAAIVLGIVVLEHRHQRAGEQLPVR